MFSSHAARFNKATDMWRLVVAWGILKTLNDDY